MQPRTAELLEYFDHQRAVLRAAFESVPAALRETPPASGRWSAAGIVEHVAILEARVAPRLSALIADAKKAGLGPETSRQPILASVDVRHVIERTARVMAPEAAHPTGLSADAAWSALERAGDLVRQAIRTGDGLAIGTISMPHPLLGSLSAYEWFVVTAAHEARHAAQIREAAGELAAHAVKQ